MKSQASNSKKTRGRKTPGEPRRRRIVWTPEQDGLLGKLADWEVAQRLSEYFPQMALTPRETEVLGLVANGLGNKEIADRLGTATGTVKIHVQNILEKLSASDRTQAVTIAIQRGILHVERVDRCQVCVGVRITQSSVAGRHLGEASTSIVGVPHLTAMIVGCRGHP